jgi:hypothetical protein
MGSSPSPGGPAGDRWLGGWEQARADGLARSLEATAAQRLAWLEEAIALAAAGGALPHPRAEWTGERLGPSCERGPDGQPRPTSTNR